MLVIDLCPQANASMMLLGGGVAGEKAVLNLCTQATPCTVVGYLSNVISNGSGAPLPNPTNFIVQVSQFNSDLPNNLYLLAGDGNLEPMAPAISSAATQPALTSGSQPWKWVHSIFRDLIDNLTRQDDSKDWIVFTNTNPSFSVYTQLAVSTVQRLITPVNAAGS